MPLTLYAKMDYSLLVDAMHLGDPLDIEGPQVIDSIIYTFMSSLKIFLS